MTRTELNHIPPNHIKQFFEDGLLLDCTLVSEDRTMKIHKIFLANLSEWFNDQFKSSQNASEITTINMPIDPDGMLFSFIKSIYLCRLILTPKNYAAYLKCAVYYRFNSIIGQITDYIQEKIPILKATQDLCNFKLDSQLLNLKIGGQASYKILFTTYKEANQNMKIKIFDIINPLVLAKMMDVSGLYDEEKVQIIDEYIKYRNITTDSNEKAALSASINWDQRDAYLLLSKYDCSWVPASISRDLYSKILTCRRRTVKAFAKDESTVKSTVSHFNVLSWLIAISGSSGGDNIKDVSVLRMCSTFGERITFNPAIFGIFNVECSPWIGIDHPTLKTFSPYNVFENNDKYYLSKSGSSINLPYFTWKLSKNELFAPTSLKISSYIEFKYHETAIKTSPQPPLVKQQPDNLKIEFLKSGNVVSTLEAHMDNDKQFLEVQNINSTDKKFICDSVKISLASKTKAGWWTFRIRSLDMYGQFLASQ